MPTKLAQAALEYAKAGFKIYPLCPGTKVPLKGLRVPEDATNELEQIIKWWKEFPDANIAMRPGANGLCVVDLDGSDAANRPDYPATYTVSTPGVGKIARGFHLWYTGKLPDSRGQLGPHTDTLCDTSQLVLPPSRIEGIEYEIVDDRDPIPISDGIAARIVHVDRESREATTGTLDLPVNVATARTIIAARVSEGRVARSGQHGNDDTFRLAARLFDRALSRETVLQLMRDEFNPFCDPPWSDRELSIIVESAGRNRQNEVGSDAFIGEPQDIFGGAPVVQERKQEASKPVLVTADEINKWPDPEELIKGLLMKGEVGAIYGHPKMGKTYVALDIALSQAAGIPSFTCLEPLGKGCVLYFSGEGHAGMKRRIRAWGQARAVELKGLPFFYHIGVPQAVWSEADHEDLVKRIKAQVGNKVVLIVFDTMSRAMTDLNENDAGDVERYLKMVAWWQRQFPRSNHLSIAHSGHSREGIRGSSNTVAGLDYVWSLEQNDRRQIMLAPKWMKDSDDLPTHYLQFQPVFVEGMKLNKTAVLKPITEQEYKARDEDGRFAPETVKEVLTRLKAIGRSHSKPTQTLAETMRPKQEGETLNQHALAVEEYRKKLTKLAKTILAAFAEKDPKGAWLWAIPTIEPR